MTMENPISPKQDQVNGELRGTDEDVEHAAGDGQGHRERHKRPRQPCGDANVYIASGCPLVFLCSFRHDPTMPDDFL